MADEKSTPEEPPGAAAPEAAAEPEGSAPAADGDVPPEGKEGTVPSGRSRRGAAWPAVLALLGLLLVLVLETAGLLLRDRLEQRHPTLGEAPAVIGETEREPATASTPGTRFGPEVKEVVVAAADDQPPPAPKSAPPAEPPTPSPPPQEPAAEPPAAAPVATPSPGPGQAAPTTAETPAPPATATATAPQPAPAIAATGTGTHALQVGLFGSQKYRRDMERQLDAAGLPHFRSQRSKQGEGYRLALELSDVAQREKAQATLDVAGVVYNLVGDTLEARFHFEDEAQRALQKLSEAGLNGGYAKTQGEQPLWVVYAGPFPREEAKRVRQQLTILGLPSYLRKVP